MNMHQLTLALRLFHSLRCSDIQELDLFCCSSYPAEHANDDGYISNQVPIQLISLAIEKTQTFSESGG